MKWVFTWRVKPPANEVVSVRFGGSVLFAAFSPALRQWFHVYPGGEERIAEPPMWLCPDDFAGARETTNVRSDTRQMLVRAGKPSRRKPKAVQLSLFR